jgi:hypothetical protein
MLNELYNVDTQTLHHDFWIINKSYFLIFELIKRNIIVSFFSFRTLYCNMSKIDCVVIILRFACFSSSFCCSKSDLWIWTWIESARSSFSAWKLTQIWFLNSIDFSARRMHCWFDCEQFAQCWRFVDVITTTCFFSNLLKAFVFLWFRLSRNCLSSNVWCFLKHSQLFETKSKKKQENVCDVSIFWFDVVLTSMSRWMNVDFIVFTECKIDFVF